MGAERLAVRQADGWWPHTHSWMWPARHAFGRQPTGSTHTTKPFPQAPAMAYVRLGVDKDYTIKACPERQCECEMKVVPRDEKDDANQTTYACVATEDMEVHVHMDPATGTYCQDRATHSMCRWCFGDPVDAHARLDAFRAWFEDSYLETVEGAGDHVAFLDRSEEKHDRVLDWLTDEPLLPTRGPTHDSATLYLAPLVTAYVRACMWLNKPSVFEPKDSTAKRAKTDP